VFFSLTTNTTGHDNTATGLQALLNNTTGSFNTAVGRDALRDNTEGSSNAATGLNALGHNTTGSGNVPLGVAAGSNVIDANNVICIGNPGANVDDSCFIGNIFGAQVGNDALPVTVDSFGKLGTMTSSRRFKTEIEPMDKTSEGILSLKPATFHYKSDKTGSRQFGLIAEDVAEISPDLVVRDKNGELLTVRYDAVNAVQG
jgi:hypothetical protein